ncbi:MAG: AsmA family protein, partial [Deltaproteobacteria bacterium]|nr:AsmA family protein [Deltaproteobacteria bacterium]
GKGAVPMDVSLEALKKIAMRLKGNLKNLVTNPGAELDITVDEFSPRELVAALGQTFPVVTADPKAISRLALKAHVKADAKNVSLSDGILDLDQSKLNFSATAADFSRPNLKFDLKLDQIDLDRYMPPKAEKPSAGDDTQTSKEKASDTAQTGKPVKKKIDYTPLRRLLLDGRLNIGKATVNKAKLQDIDLRITAKNGIIKLDPVKLNLYQGNASVTANLNVTKDQPQSDVNLLVNKVQVGPLLRDVLNKDILEGATQANLTLAMMGDDPDLIKKTLNGNGEVVFNDGAIKGLDIAGMVRNVKAAFGLAEKPIEKPRTDFAELKAPFRITNGLVNTPQTTLQSPLFRVIAVGNADLVKETLDFRVEPKAVGTLKGQGDDKQRSGLMVPVVVSGSFSSPKFRPDLSAVAKEEIGKKILESKEAKKILEKKELKNIEKPVKDALKGILGN